MPVLLWSGAAAVLALTWLLPEIREAVVERLGLHATVAIVCGVSAVALTFLQAGLMRRTGILLLLLLCWIIALGWLYVNRLHPERFSWLGGITVGLGAAILPVAIAAFYANRQSGSLWTFVQVTSLALLAAPLSSIAGVLLVALIFREGP